MARSRTVDYTRRIINHEQEIDGDTLLTTLRQLCNDAVDATIGHYEDYDYQPVYLRWSELESDTVMQARIADEEAYVASNSEKWRVQSAKTRATNLKKKEQSDTEEKLLLDSLLKKHGLPKQENKS